MSPPARTHPRTIAVIFAAAALLMAVPSVHAAKAKPDRTNPAVKISSPSAAAAVRDKITIAGSASDNVAVARVDVSLDGGPWVTATGTSSWSYLVDTRTYGNGSHSVTARAVDKTGNSSLASVSFTVANDLTLSDTTRPDISIRTSIGRHHGRSTDLR